MKDNTILNNTPGRLYQTILHEIHRAPLFNSALIHQFISEMDGNEFRK